MNEEGFREIQLNGKQLVFLFMAATVVSVVIFLFGVLVGRGVRGDGDAAETTSAEIVADSNTSAAPESSAPPVAAPGRSAEPPPAPPVDELSYAERLTREAPAEEKLRPAPKKQAEPTPPTPAPAPTTREPVTAQAVPAPRPAPPGVTPPPAVSPAPPPAPAPSAQPKRGAAAAAASMAGSDPTGPGFAVQVAASRDRREADTMAKQLVAKGYPAFVIEPAKGAPVQYFRVRVGKFKTLKEAQAVEARLQSEEQLTAAWIAR